MVQKWPPFTPAVQQAFSSWDAWWKGDTNRLYGWQPEVHPAQTRGGVVGAAARVWWGRASVEVLSNRLHVPLAADIATASSDMLFDEELDIVAEEEGSQERLDYLIDANNLGALLAESGEFAAAMGGCYLRVGWDADLTDHALLTALPQDQVLPTFRWGRLVGATTWEVLENEDGRVLRHLEEHVPGAVKHWLYNGSETALGSAIALDSHPATRGLPDATPTGYPGLAVVYVPNIRPAPQLRNDTQGKDLGRADIAVGGLDTFMTALDETWTSWMRDIRLGKARLLIASQLLDSRGPGAGAEFDLDREVYEGLRFAQPENATLDSMISAQQFSIRTTDHAATMEALLAVAIRSAGYSASTFGLSDGVAAKTATEVDSIDRRSASTREKKTRYWTPALEQALEALIAVDAYVFRQAAPSAVDVTFPASHQLDAEARGRAVSAFRAAEVMSIETGVRMAQPDLTEPEVQEEVARIQADRAATAPVDPFAVVPQEDTFGDTNPG